jgi:hypothetical protein
MTWSFTNRCPGNTTLNQRIVIGDPLLNFKDGAQMGAERVDTKVAEAVP